MTTPHQASAPDPTALSAAEFGVWLASRERVETFNVHWAWNIDGDLREAVLRDAVADLLRSNPALRRVVDVLDGTPFWRTRPDVNPDVAVVDVTGAVSTWLTQEGRHPFDLAADCPFRVRVVRSDGHAVLSILAHHIAVDGHAMGLVAAQLGRAYTARRLGHPVTWAPGQTLVAAPTRLPDDYWTEQLRGAVWPAVLNLGGGDQRADAAYQTRLPLTPVEVAWIHRSARDCRSTPLLLGLAALAVTLQQYSSERDVMIATPFAHRTVEDADLVACRAQMVPLRQRWNATATGHDLLRAMRRTVGQAVAHADGPMVAAAGLFSKTPSGQTVSFQVLDPQPAIHLADAHLTPVDNLFNDVSRFDLEFDLVLDGPAPALMLTYRPADRANPEHHLALCRNLLAAWRAIADAPFAPLANLNTLDPRAVSPVLRGRAVPEASSPTWLELFAAQAAATPGAPALQCGGEVVSFAELSQRIDERAGGLLAAGMRRGDRLAVLLPRGVDQIVLTHAAWRCGLCVVPFDLTEPVERLRMMLADAAVAAVAIPLQQATVVAGIAPVLPPADRVPMHGTEAALSATTPDEPAYLLYTSGTTGRPKGVLADHRNLAAFITAQLRTSAAARVGLTASVAFDVYLAQLVHLLRGACIVVADDDTYRNPQRLAAWTRSHDVRYLDLTVSMARAAFPYGLDTFLADTAEWLELGGEAVDPDIWGWVRRHGVRGENGYGPTETTITATTAKFSDYETPTIGLPVSGTWVYVVGSGGRLAPLGAAGELIIGGPLVTRGYPQAPRATADRFIPDPYGPAPGARAYRTGDRVRMRSDGALDFLGRVDEQLKVHGHRVDPFEVEDVLRGLPGVRQVHVARQARAGANGVVAYLVTSDEFDHSTVLRLVAERLPSAAVPRDIVRVPSLSMNVHGKVDEHALPEPVRQESPEQAINDDPVLQAWAAHLGTPPVTDDDNFFELGGTSLTAAALVASLNQQTGMSVDLADFFSTPSVAGLRHAVARAGRPARRHSGEPRQVSPAQQRLWLAHELEPNSDEFTVPWGLIVPGAVDPAEITRRWQALLTRHDGLRLRLQRGPNGPVAGRHLVNSMPLTWTSGTLHDLEGAIDRAAHRRFDPTRDPLLELHVVTLDDDRTGFVFAAHHLVIDQTSIAVVEDEIVRGVAHDPPTSSTRWSSDEPERDRAFWAEELSGNWDSPWQELGATPTTRSHAGASLHHVIDSAGWATITNSVRRRRTTLLALLCATVWAVSERYGGTDIVVGTTMDVRRPGEESLVGLHVNPVAVRLRPDPWLDADGLVAHAASALRRAHAHRRLPFDEVVRSLHHTPSRTGTPVFQMLLDVAPRTTAGRIESAEHVAKYDLSVTLSEDGLLGVTYRTDRFTATQVKLLSTQLAQALGALAASTDKPTRLLQLLDAAQEQQIAALERGDTLTAEAPMLPDLLRRHAEQTPDRPALTCDGVTLSWGDLWSAASRVTADLGAVGVMRGDLVVVNGRRSAELVVAATGVLLSGAGYVPINPELPDAQWRDLVGDIRPAAVVSVELIRDGLLEPAVPRLVAHIDRSGTAVPSLGVASHDPAYVIHTSGTTGRPKAVVVDHARLAYSTAARRQVYGGRITFLLLSALTFDSSVAGLWGTLAEGGHVVVATDDEVRDPERLLAIIAANHVERLLCVPSLHENLVTAAERVGGFPASLRDVVVAGEALPSGLPARHFALTTASLVNEYGPTETSVWCTYQRLERPGSISIGGPVPGAVVRLIDACGRRVPLGVRGEICVGGPGVADGYRDRPSATAAAFVPDPWGAAGTRLYRTGDIGRWRTDGGIDFLGRGDDMVKIRGYRVELEGVDEALRACPGVTDAAAVVMGAQLAAAVTGRPGLDVEEVRRSMLNRLPGHLVPSPMVVLDALPRNANGKLDRVAARERLARAMTRRPAQLAAGVHYGQVGRAWAEVLGHEDFGADTNFFEVGGHSLAVPALQDALRRHTGVRASLVDLFTEVTLTAQVHLMENALPQHESDAASDASPASPGAVRTGTSTGAREPSSRDRIAEARRRNARPQRKGDLS